MNKSKNNTPLIEAEVMASASGSPDIGAIHKNLLTVFTDRWTVECSDCGEKWNAIYYPTHNIFGFDLLEAGNGSCSEDEDSCIAGMICPKCRFAESFNIGVSTIMQFDAEGECQFSDDHDKEWNDDSYCECPKCSHYGTVGEFRGKKPAPAADKKPVEPNDILAFVNLIARMTADGENVEGEPFAMTAEDAISTMGELIASARKLQDFDRPNVLLVSDRELNQVLAALRHWQRGLPYTAEDPQYSEYIEDGLTFMDADDIDILCERFNLGPIIKPEKVEEPKRIHCDHCRQGSPCEYLYQDHKYGWLCGYKGEEDKFSHMIKVDDGYYCERHSKHSPGNAAYCRDCDRGE